MNLFIFKERGGESKQKWNSFNNSLFGKAVSPTVFYSNYLCFAPKNTAPLPKMDPGPPVMLV